MLRKTTRLPLRPRGSIERGTPLQNTTKGFETVEQTDFYQGVNIYGLPGTGKTQLALAFAHTRRHNYDFIRWIDAEQTKLSLEWGSFAKDLLGDQADGLPLKDLQGAIRDALVKHPRWLIVFDNVEDPKLLMEYLPKQLSSNQHILITSRKRLKEVYPIPLGSFEPEEAVTYIQRIYPTESTEQCALLGRTLHYFPLAISQAAFYIHETGDTISSYLDKYQKHHIDLLESKQAIPKGYPRPVWTTWHILLEQLRQTEPLLVKALYYYAYLQAKEIPKELLRQILSVSNAEFEKLLTLLQDYALLTRDSVGFQIHNLFQEAMRWDDQQTLSDEQLFEQRLKPLAIALHTLISDEDTILNDLSKTKQLLPHLETLLESLQRCSATEPALLWKTLITLGSIHRHLATRDSLERAILYDQRASDIAKQLKDTHDTAVALNNLGVNHQRIGGKVYLQKALEHHSEALAIWEESPSQKAHVASCLNDLGDAHRAFGDPLNLKEAVARYKQALVIYQDDDLPENRAGRSSTLSRLGAAYWSLGGKANLEEARKCYEEALTIQKTTSAPEDYSFATSLQELGNVYWALGGLENSKQALVIYEKKLGADHPHVAIPLTSVGSAYWSLGKFNEAIDYQERTLMLEEKHHGKTSPELIITLQNLGAAYRDSKTPENFKKALNCFDRALSIVKTEFGEDDVRAAKVLNNISLTYLYLGGNDNLNQALVKAQQGLAIRQKKLNTTHPELATSFNTLAEIHQALGGIEHLKEAIKHHKMALDALAQEPPNSPVVIDTKQNLAMCEQRLKQLQAEIAPETSTNQTSVSSSTIAPHSVLFSPMSSSSTATSSSASSSFASAHTPILTTGSLLEQVHDLLNLVCPPSAPACAELRRDFLKQLAEYKQVDLDKPLTPVQQQALQSMIQALRDIQAQSNVSQVTSSDPTINTPCQ